MYIKNNWNFNVDFIRTKKVTELPRYCNCARKYIIETLNKTGGHLASNLATIETIMAMHFVFDYKKDMFIFDTGHQAYLHKMLTTRNNSLSSVGSYNGWSTFISLSESKYDRYSPGHAGTSLSTSLGYLWSIQTRDHQTTNNRYVLIHIGDGAFTNGLFLQALNDERLQSKKLIIILNDNNMAIGPITGFFANKFRQIKSEKFYDLKNQVITKKFREFLNFFNIDYIPVNDGHNVISIVSAFQQAVKHINTVLIHIHTIKGYGFKNIKLTSTKYYHKVKKNYALSFSNNKLVTTKTFFSDVIAKLLFEFYNDNNRIFLIFAGSSFGNNFHFISDYDNHRFYDVGIAEEHGLILCAALAIRGEIPIYFIYSTFFQRCFDQLIHDIYNQKLKVILLISRVGISDFDGITHHGIYDISMISTLPRFTIIAPSDSYNLKLALDYSINYSSESIAIRFGKSECPIKSTGYHLKKLTKPIWIDSFQNLKSSNVIIISYGEHINKFISLINKENIHDICLINALYLKPIDITKFIEIIKAEKRVIIYEHTYIQNGILRIINSTIENNYFLQILAIKHNWYKNIRYYGIKEEYVYHGCKNAFLARNNLEYSKIISATNYN